MQVPLNPDGTPVDDPSRASVSELKELTQSLAETQVRGKWGGETMGFRA